MLEINPYCKVEAYTEGMQKENILEILKGVDVLVDEVDFESRKIIQHRAAKEMKIPVVHAARSAFPENRWTVEVRVWNFRDNPETKTREETNKLWTHNLTWDELTEDVLDRVDKETASSRKHKIRESADRKTLRRNTTLKAASTIITASIQKAIVSPIRL